jgi:TonB family protein
VKRKDEVQSRRRMFVSIVVALVLHALVFVGIQYGISADDEEPEEQFGPIMVTLNEPSPVVSQSTAQEPEPGARRERVQSETTARSEKKQREKKADTASDRERYAVEQTPASPPETGHPEITKKEPTPRLKRQDTGRRPSEQSEQYGGELQESELEPLQEYGRVENWVETDETTVIDQEWEQEEDVRKTGPVLPTRPDEDKQLAFNMESLDKALEEGGEGGTGDPFTDTATGGRAAPRRGTGAPNITWEEGSQGRQLLSLGETPRIPEWVKEQGLDLKVEISFSVTPDGHTTSLMVNRSSGFPDVDKSVIESVRKFRFNPIDEDRVARGKISYLISTN